MRAASLIVFAAALAGVSAAPASASALAAPVAPAINIAPAMPIIVPVAPAVVVQPAVQHIAKRMLRGKSAVPEVNAVAPPAVALRPAEAKTPWASTFGKEWGATTGRSQVQAARDRAEAKQAVQGASMTPDKMRRPTAPAMKHAGWKLENALLELDQGRGNILRSKL